MPKAISSLWYRATLGEVQVQNPLSHARCQVWLENANVLRPLKEPGLTTADERLFPRDCRVSVRTLFLLVGVSSLHIERCAWMAEDFRTCVSQEPISPTLAPES